MTDIWTYEQLAEMVHKLGGTCYPPGYNVPEELEEYKKDVSELVAERNFIALTLGGAREGEKTLQEVAERVVKEHAASIDNLRDVIESLTEAVKGQQDRVVRREDDLHVLRSERDDAESKVVALKHRIIQLEAGMAEERKANSRLLAKLADNRKKEAAEEMK